MKRKLLTLLLSLAMVLTFSTCFTDTYSSAASSWWSGLTPANPGADFYANLGLYTGSEFNSMGINKNNNYNVGYVGGNDPSTDEERVKSDSYKSRYWKYHRNADGSYRIQSCLYDGYYLTAEAATDGSNVRVAEGYSDGNKLQKWFIYGSWSGEYFFRNAASDCVLWYNTSYNLQLRAKDSAHESREKVQVYKFDPISGTATLTVKPGSPDSDTVFTWTKPTGGASNVAWYNVWIRKLDSSGNEVETYDVQNIMAGTTLTASKKLPAGSYRARIVPHSWVNAVFGDYVYFTVEQDDQTCTHDWSSSVIVQEPTCLQAGVRMYVCSACGSTKVEAIPKTDHSWDAGRIARKPKYFSTGVKTYTCTVCGSTKSQSLPSLNPASVTPAKVRLTSAKSGKKKLTVKWKRIAKNTKGYQIALKDKKTGKQKYINASQSSKSTLSKTIKKLKKNRKYAVRIRAYNVVGDETIYGQWSNVKMGKVK